MNYPKFVSPMLNKLRSVNPSYRIALSMALFIIIWMASGVLRTSEENSVSATNSESSQKMLVQTEMQTAQKVQLSLTVQGQVEPSREVEIRSDIPGRITEVLVEEGEWVESGTVLVRMDMEDRRIKLEKEKALLQSRQKNYTRVQALATGNFQSESGLEDAYTALKAAEASVAQIEFEINKLDIKAPFSGVLDIRMVEQGSHVQANGEVARFVDNSPLVVVVPVAQQNIQQISLGVEADVIFATGETRHGVVRYISPLASESTRTFRVEIAVDNADRAIPAGISAEVKIPTEEVAGHFISAANLSLDSSGQMGVKVVNTANTVAFYPVSIIQAATDGVWINGLPKTAQIITVGQGFVEAGEEVDVKQVNTETATSNGTGEVSNVGEIAQKYPHE